MACRGEAVLLGPVGLESRQGLAKVKARLGSRAVAGWL